jgi:hypothetical protein
MLWTIVVILFVLWLLGMVTSYFIYDGWPGARVVSAGAGGKAFNLIRGRRATG